MAPEPGRSAGGEPWPRRAARWFLRVPLVYKIVLANAAVVVLAVGAGTALVQRLSGGAGPPPALLVGGLAAAGLLLTVAVNALVVGVALSPLRDLQETARLVQEGDRQARVPDSPVADAELARLATLFNRMLDSLADYRRRLRELTVRSLDAEEQVRERLAAELNDDAAQRVAALLVSLRKVELEGAGPEVRERCSEVREGMAELLDDLRLMARRLRPPELDDVGVTLACRAHARSAAEAAGMELDFEGEPVDDLLQPETRLALYRIVQEALSNAATHAGADQVSVTLAAEDRRVVAEVADDGRGFDVEAAERSPGRALGLLSMRERARYAGGRVEVESAPEAGTRVWICLPGSGAGDACA